MAENTRGQGLQQDRSNESIERGGNRTDVGQQRGQSSGRNDESRLDEKSSTMGRRDKQRGLSSKDGLTGSDYDGQVTE